VARTAPLIPDDPAKALDAAFTRGLRLLGARELSESAIRQRLTERGFEPATVDAAADRLRRCGALDERRAARAVARTIIHVKRRGRLRAQRELESRGFSKDMASEALTEVLAGEDERTMVERALDHRLHGRQAVRGDIASMRRLLNGLVRQGFSPARARDAVRARFANAPRLDEESEEP
jgi:regulatory protein